MLGHATESIDYNLPVDSITRKPVFAFSCNRRIRETYNGPLLKTVDGDVYPASLEASVGKKIVKLYDQKVRFNCAAFNVEAVGDVYLRKKVVDTFDPAYTFPTSNTYTTFSAPYTQVRVINGWHPHLTAGNNYDLVQVQAIGGVLTNMKFGNTSAGAQWIGLGGGRGVDWEVVAPATLYCIELSLGAYFELPGASFFTEDAGVLTVCDPSNSDGRAPIFSASNSQNELCFDVGSAYMRINHYKISERHQLFGGIDSPDQGYNAYLGNFSEKTTIRNSSGFSGVSLRKDAISSGFTDGYIGRDATGSTYSGEIYELIIGDFEVPNDSVNEAFRDMADFYALT